MGGLFGMIGIIMPSIGFFIFSIIPIELILLGAVFGIIGCVCGAVARSASRRLGNMAISIGALAILTNLLCALILTIGLASIE